MASVRRRHFFNEAIAMVPREDELLVEIDGPDVAPETVDPLGILALAQSYFALLHELADDQGIDLKLTGIYVLDKCAALGSRTDDRDAVQDLTSRVASYVSGTSESPKGYGGAIERLRKAILSLPANQKARIAVGPHWAVPLSVDGDADDWPPYETITRRARPIRVGGKTPAVRFESGSEEYPFTLETTIDIARAIAGYLYQDLDIRARVHRNPDNRIAGGRLISFEPLDEGDATEAWRAWYRQNAGDEYLAELLADQGNDEHIGG